MQVRLYALPFPARKICFRSSITIYVSDLDYSQFPVWFPTVTVVLPAFVDFAMLFCDHLTKIRFILTNLSTAKRAKDFRDHILITSAWCSFNSLSYFKAGFRFLMIRIQNCIVEEVRSKKLICLDMS